MDRLAKEVKDVVTKICTEQCILSDQLLPKNAAPHLAKNEQLRRRIKEKDKKNKPIPEPMVPGTESFRKTREKLSM